MLVRNGKTVYTYSLEKGDYIPLDADYIEELEEELKKGKRVEVTFYLNIAIPFPSNLEVTLPLGLTTAYLDRGEEGIYLKDTLIVEYYKSELLA